MNCWTMGYRHDALCLACQELIREAFETPALTTKIGELRYQHRCLRVVRPVHIHATRLTAEEMAATSALPNADKRGRI